MEFKVTQTTFSSLLKEELIKRQSRNKGYSLRAFSKMLGLSSSFVSKVLSGKKNLSEQTMLSVASRLNLDESVIEDIVQTSPKGHTTIENIEIDQFQYISDWHHYAILECVTLQDFESTPEWFSRRLGITVERASSAIDRLVRLNLLSLDDKGDIIPRVKNNTTISSQVPAFAHTEHERQLLNKALNALDDVPKNLRSQTSITMAIPESRIDEARQKIIEFQREMMKLLQRRGKRDSVYHLSISFFPLTYNITKKNNETNN